MCIRYNAGEALSAELWKNGKGPLEQKTGILPYAPNKLTKNDANGG